VAISVDGLGQSGLEQEVEEPADIVMGAGEACEEEKKWGQI